MVLSAIDSTTQAVDSGLGAERIVLSCKVTEPRHLVEVYRELAAKTSQPLHLGLTEAGMGRRGVVWSTAALSILLADGIGDTIRISLTPRPGGDRCEEVRVAQELLQALGLRSFSPSVTVCPGCGRTSADTFRELALRVEQHIQRQLPGWRIRFPGVEELRVAVMGCIVNGPGESRAADIGISLPGTGETPRCPVFLDGAQVTTLQGSCEQLAEQFLALIDDYVSRRYGS
jgi:(E)-4-hydroxy-3-methylbut-2-enyl-diphosphate synthase